MPISKIFNQDCMEYMKDIPDKFLIRIWEAEAAG